MIANQIVEKGKIARLLSLAKEADMLVACDDAQNAIALSLGAMAAGSRLGVLVEMDTQMGRCGVRSIEEGVRLAESIHSLPGITFRGIMSHQNFTPTGERRDQGIGRPSHYSKGAGLATGTRGKGLAGRDCFHR